MSRSSNTVPRPLPIDPDGTFDTRYWKRTDQLPEGPVGPPGRAEAYVGTEEPVDADAGTVWFDPDAESEGYSLTDVIERVDMSLNEDGTIKDGVLDPAAAAAVAADPTITSHTATIATHTAGINGIDARVDVLEATAFNVLSYGAVGDGVADDTTAIQAAITAAFAVGGAVMFPPRIYKVTSALTTPENVAGTVSLLGFGKPKSLPDGHSGDPVGNCGAVIRTTSTTDDVFRAKVTSGNTRQYITMRDLTFEGNRAGGTTGHGLNFSAAGLTFALITHLDNVSVINVKQWGIFLDGNVMESTWHGVRVSRNGSGGIKVQPNAGGIASELRTYGCHSWFNYGPGVEIVSGAMEFHGFSANSNEGEGLLVTAGMIYVFGLQLEMNGATDGAQARFVGLRGLDLYRVGITTKPGSTGSGIRFEDCNFCSIHGLIADPGSGGAGYKDVYGDDATSRIEITGYGQNMAYVRLSRYGGHVVREGARYFTAQVPSISTQSVAVNTTIAPDPMFVNEHQVTATASGLTLTMGGLSGMWDFNAGERMSYEIHNNSAGSITCTWDSSFLLAGAWVDPGAGKTRRIEFAWNATRSKWIEQSRSGEIG